MMSLKLIKISFIIALLLLFLIIPAQPKTHIISWVAADIDNDSKDELLVITSSHPDAVLDTGEAYGDCIELYSEFRIINNKPVLKGEADFIFDLTSIKPLKIQAGDINGDGVWEIAVCVYKTTEFHPVLAKRPFFYDLADGELEPVWLGSRLARPFEDYILFDWDEDGIDEIVSIESAENGNQLFAVYDWKGFGFEVKAVSNELEGKAAFLNNTNGRQDDILVSIEGKEWGLRLEGDRIVVAQ